MDRFVQDHDGVPVLVTIFERSPNGTPIGIETDVPVAVWADRLQIVPLYTSVVIDDLTQAAGTLRCNLN